MSQNEIITKEFNVVRASTATEKANSLEGKAKAKKRSVKQAFLEGGKANGSAELTPFELASKDPSSLNADQLSVLLRTAPSAQLQKIPGLKNIVDDAVKKSKENSTTIKSELEKKAQLALKGIVKVNAQTKEKGLGR